MVHLRVVDQGLLVENAIYLDRKALAARSVDIEDRRAVASLLRSMMNERRIPTRGVILSIPGSDSILRYTAVPPVPAWRLKVIMEFEVKSVAERMGEELASDFRLLPIPRESDDDQVVLVGLAKEDQLGAILTDLEAAGIFVERAIPAPLALFAAYATFTGGTESVADDDAPMKDDLTVLVDIGRSNLNTVVVLNDNIIFAKSASYAGQSFTDAVASDLQVEDRKAESLKIKKGSVGIDAPSGHEQLVTALRGGAAQVQNVIQSALRFCRTQTGVKISEPDRIILVGGASRLFGLDTYLSQAFKKPVEKLQTPGLVPSEGVDEKTRKLLRSHPGDFAVATGLAVSALREKSFQLEIVPQKYKEKRHFRERTVFLYAAAALLLLTLIVGFYDGWSSLSRERSNYEKLQEARAGLEAQKLEMEDNYARAMRVEQRINRVLREVEVPGFQAAVMDFFERSLPSEVRLLRLQLDDHLDDTDTDFEYRMIVTASADNSDQRGIEVIQDFERRLRDLPVVASVVPERPESVGTDYEFRVVIRPDFQSYQGF